MSGPLARADCVLCIHPPGPRSPMRGRCYGVVAVERVGGETMLTLDGLPGRWAADRFVRDNRTFDLDLFLARLFPLDWEDRFPVEPRP